MSGLPHAPVPPAPGPCPDARRSGSDAQAGGGHGSALTTTVSAPVAGVIVVSAAGEIDRLTLPAWRRVSGAAARRLPPLRLARAAHLVCDLSAVSFMSVAGLRALVELEETCAMDGVVVDVVTGDSHAVARLLRVTGIDRRFTPWACVEDVVEAFGSEVHR